MPNAFNFSASPFDCLTLEERQLVRQSVNVGYYPAGAVLLAPHMPPTHLFILIKGHVVQWDGEERVSTYGPDDCFDGWRARSATASSPPRRWWPTSSGSRR